MPNMYVRLIMYPQHKHTNLHYTMNTTKNFGLTNQFRVVKLRSVPRCSGGIIRSSPYSPR